MPHLLFAALKGFLLSASLLLVVGPQNAYVLRQGLLGQHVLPVALFCALADGFLILLGVAGFGGLIQVSPLLLSIMSWACAAFLLFYGIKALRRALSSHALEPSSGEEDGKLPAIIGTIALFTFLNPGVYVDTLVLIGGMSAKFKGSLKVAFGLGAFIASTLWFFMLAYGAKFLRPLFAKPSAWQILDIFIFAVMLSLAATILYQELGLTVIR